MAVGCKQRLRACASFILAGSSLVLGACGLLSDAPADIAELEAKIALCVRIPADDVHIDLDDQGNYTSIGIEHPPGGFTEPRVAQCMQAAGVVLGEEGP